MYTVFCQQNKTDGFFRCVNDFSFPLASIVGFNRINILIGGNNSGKSRMLRNLFLNSKKDQFIEFKDNLNNWIIRNESSLKEELNVFYRNGRHIDTEDYYRDLFDFLDKYYINKHSVKDENIESASKISELFSDFIQIEEINPIYKDQSLPLHVFSGSNIYIPMLRGLNPLFKNIDNGKYTFERDLYAERIEKQYFINNKPSTIFTGQTIYNELQSMLLGEHEQREKVKEYEDFLKNYVFDGKDITLIPKIASDTVSVRIGGDGEREIHNLGDGIQSLIILTFPIFMNSDSEMMFFFEEPEINMHPGMQRIFLKTLQSLDFPHQYFFTTHSNHFIDLVFDNSDISIFMFEKVKYLQYEEEQVGYSIKRVESGEIELLKQLGVNNSSVFMSNCTIWVEGITDRLYLREYINRELKKNNCEGKYVENLHYSFIEYGGSSISHLTCSEENIDGDINIRRISNKPIIIADFDNERKHNNRNKKLGKSYYFIKGVKEIENTLHEEILKRVIAEYEKTNYLKLEFNDLGNFRQDIYKGSPLGEFIEGQLVNKKRKGAYSSGFKTTTISDKTNFADIACKYLRDENIPYEEAMSKSAEQLAKKLISFIEESNKHLTTI